MKSVAATIAGLVLAGSLCGTSVLAQSMQYYKYDALGRVVLASSSTGGQDVYAYDPAGNRSTANKTSLHVPATADRMVSGDGLAIAASIYSPSGAYSMTMGLTGLYVYSYGSSSVPWSSPSSSYSAAYVTMQSDGNLVIKALDNTVLWSSGTAGNPGATAIMQDNGKFVIKNAAGTIIWTT